MEPEDLWQVAEDPDLENPDLEDAGWARLASDEDDVVVWPSEFRSFLDDPD